MQGDIMRATLEFQSTLSVRRATAGVVEQCAGSGISIHALHEESDRQSFRRHSHFIAFQSTLSMRRATHAARASAPDRPHFNPRSP